MRPRKQSMSQEPSSSPKNDDSAKHLPPQGASLAQSVPLVVQPAVYFNDELNTPTSHEPTPLQTNSPLDSFTSLPSPVKPSLMVNAAFVGDFSSMSLWEMEQLYAYNKALLHRQKKITMQIKGQLLKMQQQERVSKNKNLSRSDLYKRFLHFLVEPKCVPTCELSKPFPTGQHKDILDTSYDRPVLKKEFDVYGSFSKAANTK